MRYRNFFFQCIVYASYRFIEIYEGLDMHQISKQKLTVWLETWIRCSCPSIERKFEKVFFVSSHIYFVVFRSFAAQMLNDSWLVLFFVLWQTKWKKQYHYYVNYEKPNGMPNISRIGKFRTCFYGAVIITMI